MSPIEIRIASPCSESWNAMQGDARQRHCGKCRKNVFNIAELTEPEVRALLMKAEGRVCARIFRRADGTVLMKDCPTGLAKLRRRALAALTMAAAMLVAMVGYRLSGPSCATSDEDASWFDRVVRTRVISARESLRETKTLGPIVNELYPVPTFTGGLMGDVAMPTRGVP
jgi:hypothetical protein